MSKMIKGRVPVASRPATSRRITMDDLSGGGNFEIPDHIKADMKEKGWTPRWISAAEVHKNQGYHKRGFKVYIDKATQSSPEALKFGQDPDGIVRRGDSILGYKDKDAAAIHQAFLRQQAGESKDMRSRQADELRAMADSLGIRTVVDDSDDE